MVPAPSIERLDAATLRLLAAATGVTSEENAYDFFTDNRQALRLALAAPEAEVLAQSTDGLDELEIAVAVHRCAANICSAAWTMNDSTPVDLDLIGFAGEGVLLRSMVDLLAGALRPPWNAAEIADLAPLGLRELAPAGSLLRLEQLVAVCDQADDFERSGALRLLADEALFSVGVLSGPTSGVRLTNDVTWQIISTVTPRAIKTMRSTLPPVQSLLDLYLLLGPVWYRMASQNLLFIELRPLLSSLAAHFDTARRFLVQVSQGPLAPAVRNIVSISR